MPLVIRTILTVLLIAALAGALTYLYLAVGKERTPLTFSPTQVLGATWHTYKDHYVEAASGRTVDPSRQNITTSEGESYTMLRAVWMADKPTFDASWNWTKGNLRHSNDQLFSWLYGKRTDGTYGVLVDQNGNVTASDADENIALSLIFAYARWQDPTYLAEARGIIADIWSNEVLTIGGTPYLVANDLEKTSKAQTAVVNPSYLSPAAYRIFSLVDSSHPWSRVVDSSYQVLTQSIDAPLDTGKSAGIPPDWVLIDKKTGAITATNSTVQTTNFGFDALRVPWNLALDYQWFSDERDRTLLSKMSFFTYTWQSAHAIGQTYTHAGTSVDPSQSTALYGGTIGYFLYEDPVNGRRVYDEKLLSLYNPDINEWKEQLSYYDDNWAWFGIGLYNQLLPNLAAGLPPSVWQ
jgi:endo-1,4-beta-D-glucanase Y